jgi:hypothetical protein
MVSRNNVIKRKESFVIGCFTASRWIATALMRRSQQEMQEVFDAEYVSLRVRKSKRAAFHLYSVTSNYMICGE